jgi:hypothetical protein
MREEPRGIRGSGNEEVKETKEVEDRKQRSNEVRK